MKSIRFFAFFCWYFVHSSTYLAASSDLKLNHGIIPEADSDSGFRYLNHLLTEKILSEDDYKNAFREAQKEILNRYGDEIKNNLHNFFEDNPHIELISFQKYNFVLIFNYISIFTVLDDAWKATKKAIRTSAIEEVDYKKNQATVLKKVADDETSTALKRLLRVILKSDLYFAQIATRDAALGAAWHNTWESARNIVWITAKENTSSAMQEILLDAYKKTLTSNTSLKIHENLLYSIELVLNNIANDPTWIEKIAKLSLNIVESTLLPTVTCDEHLLKKEAIQKFFDKIKKEDKSLAASYIGLFCLIDEIIKYYADWPQELKRAGSDYKFSEPLQDKQPHDPSINYIKTKKKKRRRLF